MNILRFPSLRRAGASSRGSGDVARLDAWALEAPLSPPPRLENGVGHPGLHLLLAVSNLNRSSIEALVMQRPAARSVLDAFQPPPVGPAPMPMPEANDS